MNIIVLIIDTLRYDYIGAHGNKWIRTPNIDSLAARSWVFDRNYTASYPTIPHRTDVVTGKYGSPLFPWTPLRHDHVTFPRLLSENGYGSQLIHDTPHLVNGGHNFDWPFNAWTPVRGAEVDRPWIDDRGLDLDNWRHDPVFDVESPAGPEETTWKSIMTGLVCTYCRANRGRKTYEDWNTARLFLTASKFLRDNARRNNFLLWVDCFDPHEPWDVPPEYALMYDSSPGYDGRVDPRSFVVRNNPRLSDAARQRIKAFYAGKVSWVDRWVGELLDTLDHTGLAKNTAVLLTADHGTNVGERGKFGKGFPVREQEGHTPFMVHIPEGGSGRSDIWVQPQDVFATVAAIAGVPVPEEIDSRDVVALARDGKASPRRMALAGHPINPGFARNPNQIFCTVFGEDYYLEMAPRPQDCHLVAYGSLETVEAEHADVVAKMHAAGLDELERRGMDAALMKWLRAGAEAAFPEDCRFWDGYPGPAGYTPYFNRLFVDPADSTR